MPKEVTSFRITEDLTARVEALIPHVSDDPELSHVFGGSVSRSAVLRLALQAGLESLEKKYTRK